MSMITAAIWVPRGIPAQYPTRYAVDDKEIVRISKLAQAQLDDARDDLAHAQEGHPENSEEEQDDDDGGGAPLSASSAER